MRIEDDEANEAVVWIIEVVAQDHSQSGVCKIGQGFAQLILEGKVALVVGSSSIGSSEVNSCMFELLVILASGPADPVATLQCCWQTWFAAFLCA
jgi:hypothetical protein